MIDPRRVSQILYNLLDNAMKHTVRGGEMMVSAKERGTHIEVTVSDNGEGIPSEDLPHIFERFYRVDKSRAKTTGGNGLGLTIARRLVEAQIWVESEPRKGPAFHFTLPSKTSLRSCGVSAEE